MHLVMEQTDGQIPRSVRPKAHMGKSSSLQNLRDKLSKKIDRGLVLQPTIGEDLEVVELDRIIKTDPSDNKHRRALLLKKQNGSWGFTLQSYGVHHRDTGQTEILTYVDYVSLGGPANQAGMRPGDVILSINGISMETAVHSAIVNYIKACSDTMRMVVLFEDCVQKVELHLRYIKLRRILMEKMFEMRSLESQEARILEGRGKECRPWSMADSSSSVDLQWDHLSLKTELNWTTGSVTSGSVNSDPFTPISTPEERSPTDGAFFGPRHSFERLSLPVSTRQRPKSLTDSTFNSTLQDSGVCAEKRPLSCILENQSQGSSLDDPAYKRRHCNSSVSGEVSFVREFTRSNNSYPILPLNYPLASPENPLCNTSSRNLTNGDHYRLPPPRRSSFRRSSQRYSINHRQSHGGSCRSNCPHNRECSDHVVTEDNSRVESDPQLLWLKHFENNPSVKRRSLSDNTMVRTEEIHRKVLRPASMPCEMETSEDPLAESRSSDACQATNGFYMGTTPINVGSMPTESPEVEEKWEEIENLSTRMSQTSISNSTLTDIPLTPSCDNKLNESLDNKVFQDISTETFGAKFSFVQSPFDASTPRKHSEKRRRSRTLSFSKSLDTSMVKRWQDNRSQETPMAVQGLGSSEAQTQGHEMPNIAQGRQLFYINEKEETTKL